MLPWLGAFSNTWLLRSSVFSYHNYIPFTSSHLSQPTINDYHMYEQSIVMYRWQETTAIIRLTILMEIIILIIEVTSNNAYFCNHNCSENNRNHNHSYHQQSFGNNHKVDLTVITTKIIYDNTLLLWLPHIDQLKLSAKCELEDTRCN